MPDRYVVKCGDSTLNVVHPDEKHKTNEAMHRRALKLRDAWIALGYFTNERVYVTKQMV